MRYLLVLFALCVVCGAGPTPASPIRCGEIPTKLYSCMGSPHLLKPEMTRNCNDGTECEKLTCVYKKAHWLNGNAIDKQKLSDYLDNYGKEHPEWAQVIGQTKSTCIQTDLPAQGTVLNCPAYDVTHCIQTNFARLAQAGQWSSTADCEYVRQFAAVCPFCPTDCFSPLIPIGACNACLSLPRSP